MNLMFYDFNGSSEKGQHSSTAQNFYQHNAGGNSLISGNGGSSSAAGGQRPTYGVRPQGVEGGGDRVPTRERGYRSAH